MKFSLLFLSLHAKEDSKNSKSFLSDAALTVTVWRFPILVLSKIQIPEHLELEDWHLVKNRQEM
jgi:hypothetical protein